MKNIVFVESNTSGHGLRAIQVAKRMGLHVTFLAENPDLFRNGGQDPLQSVDQLIVTNTYDVENMLNVIDQDNTVGVVAWDDYHLVPAAEIAERLNLYHPKVLGLNNARFKDQTRIRLQENGEQHPKFAVVTNDDRPTDSPIGYPCVVKPVDDSGSVGVRICKTQADFIEAIEVVQARTKNVRGYKLSRRWLIEEYIEGPEFSAEMVYQGGQWHMLGITKKLLTPPPFCVEVGHLFPAPLEETVCQQVKEKVLFWLDSVELVTGAVHVEFRLTDHGPVLMEINPRLGGDMIPELIRLVYGVDLVEYLLKVAIGEENTLDFQKVQANGAAAIHFVLPDRNGLIHEIKGKEVVTSLPFVTDCQLKSSPVEVQLATSSYDRLGHVIVKGQNSIEAEENLHKAINQIQLLWEDNKCLGFV